jgi:hypothetical protein
MPYTLGCASDGPVPVWLSVPDWLHSRDFCEAKALRRERSRGVAKRIQLPATEVDLRPLSHIAVLVGSIAPFVAELPLRVCTGGGVSQNIKLGNCLRGGKHSLCSGSYSVTGVATRGQKAQDKSGLVVPQLEKLLIHPRQRIESPGRR